MINGLAAGGSKMKAGKEAVAEIVGMLMMSRTYAHMAHLKTESYAKHIALNEFYDAIVGFADSLAEVAQGKYGKLDIPQIAVKGNVDKPIAVLEMHVDDILKLAASCSNGAMKNIVDEIEALYLSTLYKLKELS